MLILTDKNFDEEIKKSTSILVDFFAPWCGPCKALSPVLEAISEELKGKITVGKIDVDVSPKLAQKFNISSIPAVIIFKNGQPVKQVMQLGKESLLKEIKALL